MPASLDGDADALRAQLAPGGGSVDVVYHLAGLARLRWLREMDCGTPPKRRRRVPSPPSSRPS